MDTTTQKLMFSSKSDEWETPDEFFAKLDKAYSFTLDACATHENNKCEKYYTVDDDGLSKSWKGETVFVNPPFSAIGKWVKKSHDESASNGTTVVLLIPSRTDTRYWHEDIMQGASEIYFIKGRLKFYNKVIADHAGKNDSSPAPFPSVVVVFDAGKFRRADGPIVKTLTRT
jgi:phage N-6-adenine-methyltransferase